MKCYLGVTTAFAVMIDGTAFSQSQPNPSSSSGYTVIYSNGIGGFSGEDQTIGKAADVGYKDLPRILGRSINGEAINYQLAYNETSGVLGDVLEMAVQRSGQIDNSGKLPQRLDQHFLSIIDGINITSTGIYRSGNGAVGSLLLSFQDSIRGYLENSAKTRGQSGSSLLIRDTSRLHGIVDQAASQCKKVLFVGYSQGALFASDGLDYYKRQYGMNGAGVFYIAPALSSLPAGNNEDYVLSTADRVVSGTLPFLLGGTTLSPNLPSAFSITDLSMGHGLQNVYLNQSLPSYATVSNKLKSALGRIAAPTCLSTFSYDGMSFTRKLIPGDDGFVSGKITATVVFQGVSRTFTGLIDAHSGLVSVTISNNNGQSYTINRSDLDPAQLLPGAQANIATIDGRGNLGRFAFAIRNGNVVDWKLQVRRTVGSSNFTFETTSPSEAQFPPSVDYFSLFTRSLDVLVNSTKVSGSSTISGSWSRR